MTKILILVLGVMVVTGGATRSAPAATRTLSAGVRVHLSPRVPRLHSRLIVTVAGLHVGEGVRFVFRRIPSSDAFGGPVGTFYANTSGTLHFTYPAFLYRQEVGRWQMIGYRSDGIVAVNAKFVVIG